MGNSDRRAQTVIATLEVLLKETLNSAALYAEKEHNPITTALDRSHASGMRQWCEGRAVAYQNAINELREEFGEGGEDDNGE